MEKKVYGFLQGIARRALAVLLLHVALFSSGYAAPAEGPASTIQKTKITLSITNGTLQDFFRKVESETLYKFSFDESEVSGRAKVSVQAKNEPLDKVLEKVAATTNLEFKQVNNNIHVRTRRTNMTQPKAYVAPVAQDVLRVSGKVTDENGAGLPGVTVSVKGTTNATSSDVNGNFSLTVPNGTGTLVLSYIGYMTQEVAIENRSTINVSLAPDMKALQEVVVVGYGAQEKEDITGSVSVIDNTAFDARPNTQIGNLIQGKTAGVQVLTNSGKPSAGFNIRIRGTSSILANSDPLYVVDGVPSADTRSLNPADIESISILKDASSAAIYGAQGANGVVLITTKRGRTEKPTFEFSTYTGVSQVWNTLDVLNAEQYRDLMTELGQNTDWSRYQENTDWQKEVFQNGSSLNYQLSVSGKTDKTNYYISGGWMKQNGAVRSSTMDRASFKVNFEQKLSNWLTVGTNMGYTRYHDVDVADNQAVNQGGVILGVLSTPPVIGVYNANGTFTSNPFQDWENPISSTDGSERNYRNQRLLGNVYGELQLLPGLKFRSSFGIDFISAINDYFLDPFRTSYGRARKGIGRNSTNLTDYWIMDNTLTYTKTLGNHNFSAMVGSVQQKYKWENNSIERTEFSGTAVTTPGAGAVIQTADANKSIRTNSSFISRVTYDFANKYLLTANFRADASSVFGPEVRWGYFPSASVGWRLSEETFFPKTNVVNDVKLRVGWGLVGNDTGLVPYAFLPRVGYGANYPIGGATQPGNYPLSIGNFQLGWEASEQTNVGLDLAFLNSRISLTVDAYLKKTTDMLLPIEVPRSTGFNGGDANVGSLQNKGLEFLVSSQNLVGDFSWTTDLNLSFNRNKITNILGQNFYGGGVAGRGDASLSREGSPLALFYGYQWGGVDPATGMAYYINQNGESTFTPSPDDRTIIGNPNPDFIYGVTNTFSYKNFGLSIFLQGSQGNDIFNATRIEMEGMSDPKNQGISVINRWRNPGDVTDIPRAVWANTDNSRISSRFVEDGSYVRLKTLTLSYNLPSTLLSKIKLNSLRIYATGENLFTLTDYSGFDPEVNAFGGANRAQGIDFGTYPQTRNLILGLNLSF
ncbi:TonB-dependent receptor [Rufibacter latericius]|uniref:SusC/RagA family TonB-linked outer membrane protein n=1 Tax=Rufibacter latericius TaxID=2487040 RepID=A0A3M9MMM0_9BACT|nr:TonB-dependent receptor [Rufibacter latericius]RNI26759.1 SusC/RagA family TonB-linked outer membrane protein [Rufibacter latericius]